MENKQDYIIVAGVFKAATTSLFAYLCLHPDICGSSLKETKYFNRLRKEDPQPPFEEYLSYFTHCTDARYRLDASPDFFYGGRVVAQYIKDYLGEDTKIILLLREPINRFVSHFRHAKKFLELEQNVTIEEFIDAWRFDKNDKDFNLFPLEGSFYSHYLIDWIDVWGDNIKVMFFDTMKSNREGLLLELSDWFELDYKAFDFEKMHIENKTVDFKNPQLQNIALNINKTGAHFWQKYPGIKRNLKKVYYLVNGQESEDSLTDEYYEIMQGIYQDSNQTIYNTLIAAGYNVTDLPDWLQLT